MQTYDNIRSLQISDTPHVVSVTNIRNRKGVFFFLIYTRKRTTSCREADSFRLCFYTGGNKNKSRYLPGATFMISQNTRVKWKRLEKPVLAAISSILIPVWVMSIQA